MKTTHRFAVAMLLLFSAASAFALSDQYVQFGKGPATWIMTKDEAKQWKTIRDDAAAQAFIDLFWAKRDPSPGTPINEFRDEFDARVKYADDHFAHGHTVGSMSDRGRVLIVMGSPSRIQRTGTEPTKTIQQPDRPITGGTVPGEDAQSTTIQGYSPKMVWFFDQGKTKAPITTPTVEVAFIDQYGSSDWKLERTPRTDYISLFENVNKAMMAQPDLKSVPVPAVAVASAPTVAVATTAAAAAPSIGAYKTDALRAAVDEMRAGKAANWGKNVYVTYGEFITPAGDYFVPVQLYVPKMAGLSADSNLTFFGQVEDAQGTPVAIYEEPAKLLASKDDYYFAKSLTLQPGTYKGTFGLAQDGKPVSLVSTNLTLSGLDKSAEGVSKLLLSNNIYPMTEAQKPTDPFAFGGLKVVPKSDNTFKPADELWYFYEVRNPGLDPTANAPKLQAKITVSGKRADGKEVKMQNPLSEVDVQEAKGVAGHYIAGASLPLASFKPGDYSMKIHVVDTVTKQSYDIEAPFKVTE
ncbi:MAG TPA: GWxTD domain-containing protein [Thermoanaerobaculia bacterium]|nr:GWxTD domain-containing protein [Thermoanaerobaculia bacterium]